MSQKSNIILTVIIPTLNEANHIGGLIQYLQDNSASDPVEIILADANSSDDTAKIADEAGVKVLHTQQASRAHQMNLAAQAAQGSLLYFVHADVKPPSSYFTDILKYAENGYDFGCYRFKFDSKHPLLLVNSFFTRFKFLWCRGGDQTMFIKKVVFDNEGGFDENYVVMEDFELIKRIWKAYSFIVMPKNTLVSARKYEDNSYFKVNLANLKMFRMFLKGTNPQTLREKYYQLIKHPKDI